MDKKKTAVIFRKWKKKDCCEIIALFPNIAFNDVRNADRIYCYEHVGQHGEASYRCVMKQTVPALPIECKDLYEELTRQGYNLKIQQRRSIKQFEKWG